MEAPKLTYLLLQVFLVVNSVLGAWAAEDPRVVELLDLQSRSKDNVVHINDKLFQRFAQGDDPRPYSLFIFFDARMLHPTNPELKLKELRMEFGLTAKTYTETHAGTPEATKVFFCDIEFKEAERTFQGFKVQSLPHIRYMPEGKGKSTPLEHSKHSWSAEGVAQFVTSKTGIPVGNIVRPPPITKFQMVLIAAFVLVTLPFAVRYVLTTKTIVHDPRVWCLFALIVYFFSVSGGMYNIIRSMPMWTRDRNDPNKYIYFYSSSGAQFGVEGFSIGGLYSAVGLMLALTTYVIPSIANKQLQRVAILVCLIAGSLAVRQVAHIDNWKTGYSVHPYFPSRWLWAK